MNKLFFILLIFIFYSCKKELPLTIEEPIEPERWEKFIGVYDVYDTSGVLLYQMESLHFFSGINKYGINVDSLLFLNFSDTFDFKFEFRIFDNPNFQNIGIHDSIKDKNENLWHLSGLADDPNTSVPENTLINDTIILYFQQSNIKYYIQEGVPYYDCECKHVAVKQ